MAIGILNGVCLTSVKYDVGSKELIITDSRNQIFPTNDEHNVYQTSQYKQVQKTYNVKYLVFRIVPLA